MVETNIVPSTSFRINSTFNNNSLSRFSSKMVDLKSGEQKANTMTFFVPDNVYDIRIKFEVSYESDFSPIILLAILENLPDCKAFSHQRACTGGQQQCRCPNWDNIVHAQPIHLPNSV